MIALRRATAEDAAALARLHAEVHRETYQPIVGDAYRAASETERNASWQTALGRAASHTWLAVDENAIVGFGQASGDEIATIYLLRSHHRRGIGRTLLRALLADLRRAGHAQARIGVFDRNHAAIAFYEREAPALSVISASRTRAAPGRSSSPSMRSERRPKPPLAYLRSPSTCPGSCPRPFPRS